MKNCVVFVLFFFSGLTLLSQVLDNRNGEAFTDKPFFNSDFIKSNKLKKLKGSYTYKKPGELMKETEYKYVYEFDRNGNLISTYETRTDDGTKDTVWNLYKYDDQNHLTVHRKTDLEGFNSVYYTYDEKGRVLTEEYKREIDTTNHRVIQSLSFNKERFEYKDFEHQTKRTRFNNYDLPYLDEFFNYNDLGYLVERIERIKMTSTAYTYHYEYNEKGLLAAIRKSSNQQEGYLEEVEFNYDALGNLIEKHIFRNGIYMTEIQIIYNDKTKLLSAVLTRQVSTNFILILRFLDYEYYN